MAPQLEEAGSYRSEQRKRRGCLGTSIVPCSLPTVDLPIPGLHTGLRCLSHMEGSFVCGGCLLHVASPEESLLQGRRVLYQI